MKHQGGPCLTTIRSTCAAMSACRPSSAAKLVGPRRRGEPSVQWAWRQGLSSITRNISAVKEFARVIKLFAAVPKTNDDAMLKIHADVKYYDATTWPTHWGATEIELLLRGNTAVMSPNYASLAMLLKTGDVKSLNVLLRVYVMPPPPKYLDVDAFVSQHLMGSTYIKTPLSSMTPLSHQHGTKLLNALDQALTPPLGSGNKRNIVCAPRLSIQTKVEFLQSRHSRAVQCGRIIVRSCDESTAQPWLAQLLEGHATESRRAISSVDAALCALIREHVESVTGCPQDPPNYCDPLTAYESWLSETAWYFGIKEETDSMKPLIMLDSCEVLARAQRKSFELYESSTNPFTLLEAFCLAIPAPHSIVVAGHTAQFGITNHLTLSIANVTNIDPLLQSETYCSHDKTDATIESQVDCNTSSQRPGVSALLRILRSRHDDKLIYQVLNILRNDMLTPLVLPPKPRALSTFPFFTHDFFVCCPFSLGAVVVDALPWSWTFERPQRIHYFAPQLMGRSHCDVVMLSTLPQRVRRYECVFTLTLPFDQLFVHATLCGVLLERGVMLWRQKSTTQAIHQFDRVNGDRKPFENITRASLLATHWLRSLEGGDSTGATLDETTPNLVFHLHPKDLDALALWFPLATRIKDLFVHEEGGVVRAPRGESPPRWLEICLDNIGARLGKGTRGVVTLRVRENIRTLPLFDHYGSYERQIVRCNVTVQVRPMSLHWLTSASALNAMWLSRVVEKSGATESTPDEALGGPQQVTGLFEGICKANSDLQLQSEPCEEWTSVAYYAGNTQRINEAVEGFQVILGRDDAPQLLFA
ncbi:Bodo-specific multi-copy gene family, putative [Bodo saltans]|uniref:Bodo-specific multi-copy gene family, putative n=1 Tax=Bodo saltans TaxID=75058 RepID=A0A0S4J6B3_BODSA|nr:Bodo-specific multi-copy gene family, putative [Bodo saltans]|eukprot:CUG81926.1 Bodo-specific multi-copy gene family, putative [Bodo saltans]